MTATPAMDCHLKKILLGQGVLVKFIQVMEMRGITTKSAIYRLNGDREFFDLLSLLPGYVSSLIIFEPFLLLIRIILQFRVTISLIYSKLNCFST